MNNYVVAFIFNENRNIWLIKKQKPEWQKGCLNGIGGKIEDGETPTQAILRELEEEAGLTGVTMLKVGLMEGTNNDNTPFQVHVFTGVTNQVLDTKEEESIGLYESVNEVREFKHIENVPALIELCQYYLDGGSNFSSFVMKY